MEFAKITTKGQITIPLAIRRKLNLKDGDKVAFVEVNGNFTLVNPTMLAINDIQNEFDGEAERLGLDDIDDVVSLIKQSRIKRRESNASNT